MTLPTRTIRRVLLSMLAGALIIAPSAASPAGESPQSRPAAALSEEEMMAQMTKIASPGPSHELLKQFAGTWKTVTKAWMAPGDPMVSQGMSDKTMILGGRSVHGAAVCGAWNDGL